MSEAASLAIVRIKGNIGIRSKVKRTLEMFGLNVKHSCVIMPNKPEVIGMLGIAKDIVTWGEINKETLELLKKSKPDAKVFHLKPPRGGFRSIKMPFKSGGDLGYRADAINKLIRRML
jgi:large subunit ribosomal protein L30